MDSEWIQIGFRVDSERIQSSFRAVGWKDTEHSTVQLPWSESAIPEQLHFYLTHSLMEGREGRREGREGREGREEGG